MSTCAICSTKPDAVTSAFTATAQARRRPPVTPGELADRVASAGAQLFAARIKELLNAAACRAGQDGETGADPDS